jgi:hypothetical protein
MEEQLFDNLTEGYRTIKSSDPGHLVWQNHAPRNNPRLLAKHSAYCDLVGCDIYPFPERFSQAHSDITDLHLSSVGAYTARFADVAPDKGILMVLQGFAWSTIAPRAEGEFIPELGAPPTYFASRFMAYDAIARGANGLCYWGTNYNDTGNAAWNALVPVIQELAGLQAWLAEPEIPLPIKVEQIPSWQSLDRDVAVTVRRMGDDWLFVFVNEFQGPQTIHVELPPQFSGRRLYFLYESLYVEPAAESYIPLTFSGYGVRILSTRQDLEVESLRGLNRACEEH